MMEFPMIAGVGHNCLDRLCTVEDYPPEDGSTHITSISIQGGGAVATAVAAAARLGVSAAWLGYLGEDETGREIRRLLEEDGVDTRYIRNVPGGRSSDSYVMVNPVRSTRTKFPYPDDLPPIQWDGELTEAVQKARVLHLDGTRYENALAAAKIAKAAGVPVSLDGCSTQKDNEKNIALASMADTIRICGGALVIIVVLAILISYLVIRRPNPVNNVIDTLSMVPYIIPGSVMGIALVVAFNNEPLALTGTAVIMVICMCIRRIPYTIRSSVAVLGQIPISVEEASISLGASKAKTLFKITVPMMFSGILSGAIMSWVTLITELSSSIILYSSKTITLNLAIYVMVNQGLEGKACAVSSILTLFTVISLILFTKVSKNGEISI